MTSSSGFVLPLAISPRKETAGEKYAERPQDAIGAKHEVSEYPYIWEWPQGNKRKREDACKHPCHLLKQ